MVVLLCAQWTDQRAQEPSQSLRRLSSTVSASRALCEASRRVEVARRPPVAANSPSLRSCPGLMHDSRDRWNTN